MGDFVELFRIARAEGLGVTLHISEVTNACSFVLSAIPETSCWFSDKGQFCSGDNDTPEL